MVNVDHKATPDAGGVKSAQCVHVEVKQEVGRLNIVWS